MTDNPLEDLLADKQEINRERLAKKLQGLIRIDKSSGEPIFLEGYDNLSSKDRFVVYLLYRRAAVSLELIDEEEIGETSGDIAEKIGTSSSTVRNHVRDLPFIERDEEHGGYYISPHQLERAMKMVPDSL